MVGSGVYLLPASLAPLGWASVAGWAISISGALALALCIAALTRAMPDVHGPIGFARALFGPLAAFAVGWSFWISSWVAIAAIAVAGAGYLSVFLPGIASGEGTPALVAIGFIWLFTAINLAGARTAGGVQVVATALKMLPLAAVALLVLVVATGGGAAGGASPPPVPPDAFALAPVMAATALTLWAMLGFESASVPAAKVRDPYRTIPRATIIGTAIVGLIYVLTCSGIALLSPVDEVAKSNAPFADFVARHYSAPAGRTVALLAAISVLLTLNGWVLLQGEAMLTLVRTCGVARWFGRTSGPGTPVRAILVSSTLATIVTLSNYSRSLGKLFEFMALLSTVATLLLYLSCAAGVLTLAATSRIRANPFLIGAAAAGAAFTGFALVGAGAEPALWGGALILMGLPIYLFARERAVAVPA